MTKTNLKRAQRRILRAIETAKRTKGWPTIEQDVSEFLNAGEGADQFKKASELSRKLYIEEDRGSIDMKTWDAFHKLRSELVPLAQLCWPWYQKGDVASFWQSLWEILTSSWRQ